METFGACRLSGGLLPMLLLCGGLGCPGDSHLPAGHGVMLDVRAARDGEPTHDGPAVERGKVTKSATFNIIP